MYSCSFILKSHYHNNAICFATYVTSNSADKCIVIESKKVTRFTEKEIDLYLNCLKKIGFKFKVSRNSEKFTKDKVKGLFIYDFKKIGLGVTARKYETIFCIFLRFLWEDSENTYINAYPGKKFHYDDFYVCGRIFLRLVQLFPRTNKLKLMHTVISIYSSFGFRYNSNHFFVPQRHFPKRDITKLTKENVMGSVTETFTDWDDGLKKVNRIISARFARKFKSYDDYTVINDKDLYVFHKLINDLEYNIKLANRKNLKSIKTSIKRKRKRLNKEYEEAK